VVRTCPGIQNESFLTLILVVVIDFIDHVGHKPHDSFFDSFFVCGIFFDCGHDCIHVLIGGGFVRWKEMVVYFVWEENGNQKRRKRRADENVMWETWAPDRATA
jgi:hypothetical protein